MLPFRSHWRFASERDPFGEARLLGFAGTPDATNPPDPLEGTEFAPNANPNLKIAEKASATVEDAKNKTHTDTEALMQTPEEVKAAADKRKKEEEEEKLKQE